jgi:hypothetical protein
MTFGFTGSATITITNPSPGRIYTLPDVGANSNFVMDSGGTMLILDTPGGAGEALVSTSTTQSNWRPLLGSDIGLGTPSFTRITLSQVNTQLTLGTTNTVTISSPAPAASRTYTLHDAGAAANFVLSVGTAQTISDTAAAGEYLIATSGTASNWAPLAITNQFAESTTNITGFSTSSYTTVTSMTFSLTAGTWICSFSTVILASDTAGVDIAIHLNSVINSSSACTITTATTASVHSQTRLVPGSSLTADVRWRKTGGGTVDMYARNFYCFKVG